MLERMVGCRRGWLVAGLLTGFVAASAAQAGPLVAIGGGLEPSNEAVYGAILELAEDDTTFCVFGTASSDPEGSAETYVSDFASYGARAVVVDITVDNAPASTSDDEVLTTIRSCGGFFFTGGDQRRITEAWLETPALTALRERFDAGVPVAGTSAGLAVMSETMISGGESIDTLLAGPTPVTLEPGLGFVGNVILDQHSLERGRFGRLLGALAETGIPLGVGVGENTALVIPETGPWEVVGEGHAVILELPQTVGGALDTFAGVQVSLISSGDTFDPETGEFRILAERSAEEVGSYYDPGTIFAADVFGPDVLGNVLERLIDSPETSASGIGFLGGGEASFTAKGLRLVFSKGNETQGYWGRADGADYSIVRVELRADPIEVTVRSE